MDEIAKEKQSKEEKNKSAKLSSTDDSLQRLRNLFLKTEEMNEMADSRNREIEDQFQQLQQRLNKSSGFLNHIKQTIENIKLCYQKDIMDLEMVTEKNREEIDGQIEEIQLNIDQLKTRVREDKVKPETYEDAFNDVLNTFQNIKY